MSDIDESCYIRSSKQAQDEQQVQQPNQNVNGARLWAEAMDEGMAIWAKVNGHNILIEKSGSGSCTDRQSIF